MKILLDTHALLWSFVAPASLSEQASAILAEDNTEIIVSAVSAWEIATKVRIGKLPEAVALERRFLEALAEVGYLILPIDPQTALSAGRFNASHGDPFDRMIAAQAIALNIPVLSKDPQLDQFGVRRIW